MHTAVTGLTGCGKSTLVMKLFRGFRRQGFPTMVLTAVEEDLPRWQQVADFVTMDEEAFDRVFWSPASRGFMAAIDEGSEFVGRYDKVFTKCFTRGRRRASLFAIAQRTTDLNRSARSQCQQVIAFGQDAGDAKALISDTGKRELIQVADLERYEYLVARRFEKEVRRGRVTPL